MAGGSRRFILDIPPDVSDVIRHLPADPKRGIPAGKILRIGVLWHAGSEVEERSYLTALRQAFRDLGYADGRTL